MTLDDPKEIFYCGTPGCSLSFVRKDLCDRHRKRHSQQFLEQQSIDADGDQSFDVDSRESDSDSDEERTPLGHSDFIQSVSLGDDNKKRSSMDEHDASRYQSVRDRFAGFPVDTKSPLSNRDLLPPQRPGSAFHSEVSTNNEELQRAVADANEYLSQPDPIETIPQLSRYPSNVSADMLLSHADQNISDALKVSPYASRGDFTATLPRNHSVSTHTDGFEIGSPTMLRQAPMSTAFGAGINNFDIPFPASRLDDQNFGISPSAGTDEFTSWLFDQNGGVYNGQSNGEVAFSNVYQPNVFGQVYSNYFSTPDIEIPFTNTLNQSLGCSQPLETIAVTEASLLSSWKRQNLLEIMQQRFSGSDRSGFYNRSIKQQIFEGNVDDDEHILSMSSLHRYIDNYWKNFHDQFPILHQPSFLPNFVHEYLLMAVVVMGASLLTRYEYRTDFGERAAQLANFIAWNLRWQVFTDPESCPPAKLWVLQTLAILEVYEKTNSTRALHERAHVHFAATLTLMRRGSALVGDSTPLALRQAVSGEGSHTLLQGEESPPRAEKWWDQWIAQEATRRAAFGAFLLDSMHAIMFGHTATMVIHEIQLPLPCDDTLWSAPTSSEVGRIEFSLYTNGIKPMTFLTGLKRTLSCRRVRTNPFGRIVLIAGLLSVSWHMHQRDLYGKSLDKDNMGVPEGWKAQLVKALEWWKKDFDESLAYMRQSGIDVHKTGFTQEHVRTSDSLASVLYHLGHIGVQVDMPDLCILAGAKTLLGRVITMSDRERVHIRMKAWATCAAARHAVHYSVRFICSILLQDTKCKKPDHNFHDAARFENLDGHSIYSYRASADFLLPRPWVLYFSTLVVWAYGFLLEGQLRPYPDNLQYPSSAAGRTVIEPPLSPQTEPLKEREQDAKTYLKTMARYESPAALEKLTMGRNKVIGLISVVSKVLEGSQWELLNEARDRLRGAAECLRPAPPI